MGSSSNLPADGDANSRVLESQLSFSGCDIIMSAFIKGKVYILGSIETISISTHRDTAPVRVLGSDAPIKYKQGTRTVSGTMVFSKVYGGNAERLFIDNPEFAIGDIIGYQAPDRTSPFDITISIGTEYSEESRNANLLGVTLMSSGLTLSVHDIYTEQTYGYVAREYIDLHEGLSTEIGISNDIKDRVTLSSIYAGLVGNLIDSSGQPINPIGSRKNG